MGLLIGCGILSVCVFVAWMVLRRPLRQIVEDVHVDHARALFHQQREWLEARFISALGKFDPAEGQRWEAAQWHDEVLWAHDRQTRYLLALVCVHFDPGPFDEFLGRDGTRRRSSSFARANGASRARAWTRCGPTRRSAATSGLKRSSSRQPHPRRVG